LFINNASNLDINNSSKRGEKRGGEQRLSSRLRSLFESGVVDFPDHSISSFITRGSEEASMIPLNNSLTSFLFHLLIRSSKQAHEIMRDERRETTRYEITRQRKRENRKNNNNNVYLKIIT
jgi:hypothetical protein